MIVSPSAFRFIDILKLPHLDYCVVSMVEEFIMRSFYRHHCAAPGGPIPRFKTSIKKYAEKSKNM